MNTIKYKRTYIAPEIEAIHLDNDISLTLDSSIPAGDPEGGWGAHAIQKHQDPFKENRA